jgi:hypothetical protein
LRSRAGGAWAAQCCRACRSEVEASLTGRPRASDVPTGVPTAGFAARAPRRYRLARPHDRFAATNAGHVVARVGCNRSTGNVRALKLSVALAGSRRVRCWRRTATPSRVPSSPASQTLV